MNLEELQRKLWALEAQYAYWSMIAPCAHANQLEEVEIDLALARNYWYLIEATKQEIERVQLGTPGQSLLLS